MIEKCVYKPDNNQYECLQWNWNFVEVYEFTEHKAYWREKLEGLLVLHNNENDYPGTQIELGDYIVRFITNDTILYLVYNEEKFNELFEILED